MLYLDSVNKRNIEEVSSCNIFIVKVLHAQITLLINLTKVLSSSDCPKQLAPETNFKIHFLLFIPCHLFHGTG